MRIHVCIPPGSDLCWVIRPTILGGAGLLYNYITQTDRQTDRDRDRERDRDRDRETERERELIIASSRPNPLSNFPCSATLSSFCRT